MTGPAVLLDAAGIAALIPHSGRMCLLEQLVAWDDGRIQCRTRSHHAADHPLRSDSGLLACHAIEYAAQAMALHGGLLAQAAGGVATPGYLASVRGVQLHRWRLDDLPGPLDVQAERLAGDERQLLYAFTVRHDGQAVAEGRAAVVLNTPLP
ncbi:hydroxymyristoyl-ACP dehydratase [Sphaerotilus microaerophilus]|uniref:Phosphotransferase n=1 Tax=Sphaerotilus microaerophilus TaxID=2914710 RepID=A0ABM7YS93_9BURK|nr:hydroxymyristoyl-ACP dehydratase [Sphaerotilus sp. FB-5]BDI07469.1 phosphotransferase [Sphaerotilus sp. FB-5]